MGVGGRALPFFIAVSVLAVAYSLFITWQYVAVLQKHIQSTHSEHHHIVTPDAMLSSVASAALLSLKADGRHGEGENRDGLEQPRRAGGHEPDVSTRPVVIPSPPPVPAAPPLPPPGPVPVDPAPVAAAAQEQQQEEDEQQEEKEPQPDPQPEPQPQPQPQKQAPKARPRQDDDEDEEVKGVPNNPQDDEWAEQNFNHEEADPYSLPTFTAAVPGILDPVKVHEEWFDLHHAGKIFEHAPLTELDGHALPAGKKSNIPCWYERSEEAAAALGGDQHADELHCMPSYIILGVAKSGTSVLYNSMVHHPRHVQAITKETHFYQKLFGHRGENHLWLRRNYTQKNGENFLKIARGEGPRGGDGYRGIHDWPTLALGDASPENFFRWNWHHTHSNRSDPFFTRGVRRRPDWPRELRDKVATPELIYNFQPGLKIILRNPARRAASQYNNDCVYCCQVGLHEREEGWKFCACPISKERFHDAVTASLAPIKECHAKYGPTAVTDCTLLVGTPRVRAKLGMDALRKRGSHQRQTRWLLEGIYVEIIRVWLMLFPRRNVLVIPYESLMRDPRSEFERVFDHIGIGNDIPEHLWERIAPAPKKPREEAGEKSIGAETERLLSDFYAPFNRQLAELLGDERFATMWDYKGPR